ncbi:cholesterol oxidase substrate-binding domain-containing protein [Streptomyces broussonetiae]|uniref:cholesterol oxidase substrate-binding domain-containing protein n=1 Tax=Streptomyces broussonetiae TaxID=2686304 RepID=UPI00389ACE3E
MLRSAAALAATPVLLTADPATAAAELPGFPAEVTLYRTAYRNWVGEITAEGLWACAPNGPQQVLAVVNWAWRRGWRVRARGCSHGWSPLTISEGTRTHTRTLLEDADCAALLAHLGRAFVTEVVLRVGPDTTLRCVSRTDIPARELFAAPGSGGRTLESFLRRSGRIEAIWFAFTEFPWLKEWSVTPRRPPGSRHVTSPYSYPFSDSVPTLVADLVGRLVAGAGWYLAPEVGNAQLTVAGLGLAATDSADLWGPSKNTLLYVRPTTLRVSANGYAVLTSRAGVQRVVHEFTARYRELLAAYAARGRFPVNGPVEIRVTGLDDPADPGVPGARAPLLSALRPSVARPEWDSAVWLDVLTLPGTPDAEAFLREVERFLLVSYDGRYALARAEWSKGWAYTADSAWADPEVLGTAVPGTFGRDVWTRAVTTLDRLDPHRVFTNAFLDRLLR